jgi:uncharacterized membrane protein
MDPEMIMTIVVSLIILGVGVFAFFIVVTQIGTNIGSYSNNTRAIHASINNTSNTGNSVFNIVGVVLIIGAIMTIVGLVYSYVRPGGY